MRPRESINFDFWGESLGVSNDIGVGDATTVTQSVAETATTLSPVTVLIGIALLLLMLKILGELPTTAIDPRHLHIGGYNLLVVTLTSVIGISLLKLVFNRWPVPAVTELVNFV